MKKLSIAVVGMAVFFVTGCGNSNSSTNSVNAVEKEVNVANSKALVLPANAVNSNDRDAFTNSNIGIIEPVSFPTSEKINSSDINNYNGTVTDVIKNNIQGSNVYTVTNAKVAPKIFSSADHKLSAIFNFNPKLPFDASVAVTNYKSLLALPNNGLDILKAGLEPIPEISGDIAYFDVNGNRMLDINKDFNESNTTVDVYLFFKDVNLTNGKYKLYTYDYNGSYNVKDIEINNSTVQAKVVMNKISSFVIAKQNSNIKEINTTVDYLPPYIQLGVIALDDNNNVVGIGEYHNNKVNVYTLKQPSKYVYVSYFLKNGKKEVTNLEDLNLSDFDTDKYPLDFTKLSDNDKEILNLISSWHDYVFEWSELSNYMYPEKLFSTNNLSDFSVDLENVIETYIKNGSCSSTTLDKEYNSTNYGVKVLNYSCSDDNGLNLKVIHENNTTESINISKNNVGYKVIYKEDIPAYESDNVEYTLINSSPRVIKDYTENYNEKSVDEYSGDNISTTIQGKYLGNNMYLAAYTESFKQFYSDIPKTDTISYDVKGSALITYNYENNSSTAKDTYEVSNINSNEENVTINGKNFVFDGNYVNGNILPSSSY